MIAQTQIIMGMPITITLTAIKSKSVADNIYEWFEQVDRRFSPFRPDSELSCLNSGQLDKRDLSPGMLEIFDLADKTWRESHGYFDARKPDGTYDPSGIVKGWAIKKATEILRARGVEDYCIDAGGDIQSDGISPDGETWRIGIRSPFNLNEVVKVVSPMGAGIATSGSYIRGQHIWNPLAPTEKLDDVLSITVIGPDILDADRFATAAFAMGRDGIYFIEQQRDLEAYQIDARGVATQTSGFQRYVLS